MEPYSTGIVEPASDFPAQLVEWYHDIAQPGTTFCVEYLGVPTLIAPMLSIAVLVFCPLYFIGMFVFGPSCLGYTGPSRWEMASCVPSMVHGLTSSYAASIYMIRHWTKYGFIDNDLGNKPHEVALMQFCCAYFLEDLFLFIMCYAPQEMLFACHHILVLAFMKIGLYLGFGSISSVVSISMGELTSPLQNVWFWLKHLRYKHKMADEIFAYISWIYSAFYIFVRSFFGAVIMSYNIYRVTQTKKYPTWLICFLALMLVGGTVASQTWCWKLSKRLWHPYRRAYGTQQKSTGEHIDNYTSVGGSDGTASSSGASSGTGAAVGPVGSFTLADKLSPAITQEGKKAL